MAKKHYDGSKIEILENLEPVRLRPAMYVGDSGYEGLHHIVWEVLDNAVDEYMDGHVSAIAVRLDTATQTVTVTDDGRGIPVSKHKKTGLPLLTAVLTKLHSGGKFGTGAYTSAVGGLHGVGIKATNALSEKLAVWTVQNGKVYHQSFEKGEPTTKVQVTKKVKMKSGVRIKFRPDFTIFNRQRLDPEIIRDRLQTIAYLCPGLRVAFKCDRTEPEEFYAERGLKDMLDGVTEDLTILHDPIVVSTENIDAILAWTDTGGTESWRGFVNVINTPDGTHINGSKRAIQRVLSDISNGKNGRLSGEDLRDGLVAIVHAHVLEPEFRGQTKKSLRNADVADLVGKDVEDALRAFAANNTNIIKGIIERAVALRDSRKKFRAQQKAIRETKVRHGAKNILPGKLCEAPDCSAAERELFIVEGASAFGTVQQARVTKKNGAHFQEILPLRGKVLNTAQKRGVDEVLKNAELFSITQAIGTGLGPAFDLAKCRYDKILLLMDADSDGRHIQALLLAFFSKHLPQLIDDGRLFIVESPLFMGVTAKSRVYGNTVQEVKKQLPANAKLRITRFKGLGESEPRDLRTYAMQAKTRGLCRVLWGGEKDQKLVLKYMGLDATARKELLGVSS